MNFRFDTIVSEAPLCSWRIASDEIPPDIEESEGNFMIQWRVKITLSYHVRVESTKVIDSHISADWCLLYST